jgi:hypothetical protein
MRKILEHCPSCGSDLMVTHLICPTCKTMIQGEYKPCPYCKLPPKRAELLEAFLKARGNLREMERELGISYWTIRRMIDDLIQELGFEERPIGVDGQIGVEAQVQTVLDRLDRGEISADAAEAILSQLERPAIERRKSNEQETNAHSQDA